MYVKRPRFTFPEPGKPVRFTYFSADPEQANPAKTLMFDRLTCPQMEPIENDDERRLTDSPEWHEDKAFL